MNSTKRKIVQRASLLALFAALVMAYSCSPETSELEDGLEKRNGKTNTSILKTLVRGASLNAANGIDIGPDGNLYIASVNGQEIIVMDKNNGKIIDRITEGVQSPDDLVFGSDGSLYWTDIITGEVGKLSSDRTSFKKQAFLPGVNPIAFNDEDRLFIALDFLGDGLYEFDTDLDDDPRTIIECPTGFCLGFFNSFDFGPDGLLYGPLFALGQVIKVNVENGDYETVATGFVNPAAAKFGPDGLLTVLDQTGEVWKVDTKGAPPGNKTLFTTLQPGLDNMVFDDDGSLYMTNNDEGWVAEILPSGQARILSPGGMIVPQGIAVMPGSNQDVIFQADLFTLRQFNGKSGQQEDQFKGFLVPPPGVLSLTLPQNISVSGDDLVISSFFSSTVQVFNPESGEVLPGQDYADQVIAPIDAVRLNSGEVIVSDIALGGVFRMTDNLQLVPLVAASGLVTDGESVWAADWGTGNIFRIDFDAGTPTSNLVASGLSFPEGLALDNEGRLLVFETKGLNPTFVPRLSRIDFSSGTAERTTIVEGLAPKEGGLPGFPPMWLFDGVDVGASGDIYLTGGEDNVIHKISKNKVR